MASNRSYELFTRNIEVEEEDVSMQVTYVDVLRVIEDCLKSSAKDGLARGPELNAW